MNGWVVIEPCNRYFRVDGIEKVKELLIQRGLKLFKAVVKVAAFIR